MPAATKFAAAPVAVDANAIGNDGRAVRPATPALVRESATL